MYALLSRRALCCPHLANDLHHVFRIEMRSTPVTIHRMNTQTLSISFSTSQSVDEHITF